MPSVPDCSAAIAAVLFVPKAPMAAVMLEAMAAMATTTEGTPSNQFNQAKHNGIKLHVRQHAFSRRQSRSPAFTGHQRHRSGHLRVRGRDYSIRRFSLSERLLHNRMCAWVRLLARLHGWHRCTKADARVAADDEGTRYKATWSSLHIYDTKRPGPSSHLLACPS